CVSDLSPFLSPSLKPEKRVYAETVYRIHGRSRLFACKYAIVCMKMLISEISTLSTGLSTGFVQKLGFFGQLSVLTVDNYGAKRRTIPIVLK
ncbi:MAG: hypothetical protein IK133_09325, partial [Clostridia bacterium]|nr:hypothetical protein [Clostridia bacterium]